MLVPIGQIVFISDYFFLTTHIVYLLSGVVLIQVACLLCSVLVITTQSAPLEKEIRTTEEEKHEGIPPIMTATRQMIESELPEKEERSFPEVEELAESEYPVAAKEDREFREVNAEEFFRRLERELATKMARREGINEKGNKDDRDFELKGNDEKREEIELPAEMFKDEQDEVSRKSPKDEDLTTSDESVRRELEEMLAREIAEKTNKHELGEEEEEKELMPRPERMFLREVPEKSERIFNREIKTAVKEDDRHNKHGRDPSEEGRKIDPEEEREKHEENTASNQKREDEEEEEEEEEEERAARSRELNFRTMHSGEITPEWKKLDERVRASEEREWREREAERERERFDYHGNKEREREELRERRREEALENGKLVHEREMEGRKQRETLGSHGARLEERERFRFRARGN